MSASSPKIVYDCFTREVALYSDRGYRLQRGNEAFLIWSGYFSDLMHALWAIYGWEQDPEDPMSPHLEQMPLLKLWNADGLAANERCVIADVKTTARAVREAVQELRRKGPSLPESPTHGAALADFLEQADHEGKTVIIEECW